MMCKYKTSEYPKYIAIYKDKCSWLYDNQERKDAEEDSWCMSRLSNLREIKFFTFNCDEVGNVVGNAAAYGAKQDKLQAIANRMKMGADALFMQDCLPLANHTDRMCHSTEPAADIDKLQCHKTLWRLQLLKLIDDVAGQFKEAFEKLQEHIVQAYEQHYDLNFNAVIFHRVVCIHKIMDVINNFGLRWRLKLTMAQESCDEVDVDPMYSMRALTAAKAPLLIGARVKWEAVAQSVLQTLEELKGAEAMSDWANFNAAESKKIILNLQAIQKKFGGSYLMKKDRILDLWEDTSRFMLTQFSIQIDHFIAEMERSMTSSTETQMPHLNAAYIEHAIETMITPSLVSCEEGDKVMLVQELYEISETIFDPSTARPGDTAVLTLMTSLALKMYPRAIWDKKKIDEHIMNANLSVEDFYGPTPIKRSLTWPDYVTELATVNKINQVAMEYTWRHDPKDEKSRHSLNVATFCSTFIKTDESGKKEKKRVEAARLEQIQDMLPEAHRQGDEWMPIELKRAREYNTGAAAAVVQGFDKNP
jgi:hypothetical protein